MSNCIILDVETNGLPDRRKGSRGAVDGRSGYRGLHVIELGFLHASSNTEFSTLLRHTDPDMIDIRHTTRFHNITEQMIDLDGVCALEVLRQFFDFLIAHNIDTIIAHNAEFDVGFLISESEFYGQVELAARLRGMHFVCTMKNARVAEFMESSKWPKLGEVFLKITHEHPKQAHRALNDCYSCREIYNHLWPNSL
jgi:DNA polymerase III epsilon subunit-like protein